MLTTYEYVGNMHVHTTYSDGTGTHREIAEAAIKAGLDFVIVTDHNVLVKGVEGYYTDDQGNQVLLLVGEELHDMRRRPQANHLLAYGVDHDLATYTQSPQELIERINETETGFCFIAHPTDKAAETFNEGAIPWQDWEVSGFTGLEIWNYMSEFKSRLTSYFDAVRAVLNPDQFITGPDPDTLERWNKLHQAGIFAKAIGNADAHAFTRGLGPIERVIFPYEYLFRCVNTHIVTRKPLSGNLQEDRTLILDALREGRSYIGYDLPAPTAGFRFSAQGYNFNAMMGGEIKLGHGVTLQMGSPLIADMRLLRNGEIVAQETEGTHRTYIADKPGIYRVEVYLEYKNKPRGWIFSNPIRVF